MKEQIKAFVKQDNGVYRYVPINNNQVIGGDTDSVLLDLGLLFDETADIDTVVETADWIGEETNKTFPAFMQDVFNVPQENAHIMKTERETVSSQSLFRKKKNYIMRIMDKEGKRVDTYKITGLDIRRSDTPKTLKAFLKELAQRLMDKEDDNTIHESIEQFKKAFYTKSIHEIGRPMGSKALKEYENLYEETGTKKGFPYHIRACMFYNEQCTMKDSKIRPGDKVILTYIKHPESKYIAIPKDVEVLPDFIHSITIDYDVQWNKALKKINYYLAVVGKDPESLKKQRNNDLFGL